MTEAKYDVLAIGNAIVDVLDHVEPAFLETHGISKGVMHLIDEPAAEKLSGELSDPLTMSGGSAGNSIAGLADLGAKTAYIGKVKNDALGERFKSDMTTLGVTFQTPPATDGPATARCLVLVTPDADRTLNTFLGACGTLSPDDVDDQLVKDAQVTYLEGYLWDRDAAKDAFRKAIATAKASGRKVALTLSDPFCVDRHRAEFQHLVEHDVDILFANEDEISSLYETDFDTAKKKVSGLNVLACLTRSEKGCVIVSAEGEVAVAADPVDAVVDTTGAGDLFAAGFLYGYTQKASLKRCAEYGSMCAAEVISHFGARPQASLKDLAAKRGWA